jgi:hypothetical protein
LSDSSLPTSTLKTRWWTSRPWAHELLMIDTDGWQPGRHHAAPLLEPAQRRRRAHRAYSHELVWRNPAATLSRLGLDAFARARWSCQLPASVRVVADAEAARLEAARREIAFHPSRGFLHSTQVGRLQPELRVSLPA